jgi:FMN phosphatase YigB (HAD superfamily)
MDWWLDFDRTLFNADEARAYWGHSFMDIVHACGPFAPGSLAQFIYPDAWEFLTKVRARGDRTYILSSYVARKTPMPPNDHFQRAKIAACGLDGLFDAIHVVGEEKGAELAHYADRVRPTSFIDDMPHHLDSARAHAPWVGVVCIDRGQTLSYPGRVVHTLTELL